MADTSLRSLYFTAQFACDVARGQCRELSAPGLAEMYPQLLGHLAKKRKLNSPPPTRIQDGAAASSLSPSAKKRAKKQEAKAKAADKIDRDELAKRAAQSAKDKAAAAARDRGGARGGGAPGGARGGARGGAPPAKGGGKGLPDGAVRINPNTNKEICFGYSKGTACSRTPCNFEHVCWFCFGNHPGKDCELARGPAPAPRR